MAASLEPGTVGRLREVATACGTDLSTAALTAFFVLVARLTGDADARVQVRRPGDADGAEIVRTVDERVPWSHQLSEVHRLRTAPAQPSPPGPVRFVLWLADRSADVPPGGHTVLLHDEHGRPVASTGLAGDGADGATVRLGLARLLAALASEPDGRPADTDPLTPAQRHRVLVEWSDTAREYPMGEPMHAAFERHARLHPDAVAAVDGDHAVSYRALDRRAEQWARRCAAAGAGPERVVGVHLDRSVELLAVLLGVLRTGAAYLPLDPGYPAERLRFMAADAGLVAVVSERPAAELPDDVALLRPDGPVPPSRPAPRLSPDTTAYLLYTSGSTGRPKGVEITHGNVTDLLYWCAETFSTDLRRVLATTSICFDCSILEIFGPLSCGGTVVLSDSALTVGSVAVGHDVALLHTVPSVMAELIGVGLLPSSLTTVLLGGEPPWPSLVDDVYRGSRVRRLLNVYGPTECTSYASTAVIEPRSAGTPPIGRPVANTVIRLLDRYGGLSMIGAPGEIYIGGRGVARGYLHRPALTAERFVPDPFGAGARLYRTGDLARHDPTGELTFLGRVDDQVKVRGVRVEPAEVEQALLRHPGVLEAVVTAPSDGRPRLLAFVVVVAGSDPVSTETLRGFASSVLPREMIPDAITVLPRLPRTPNGKIDRSGLRIDETADCAATPFLGPPGALETRIAQAWSTALRVPRVGRHDDFYALGGHSLSAMRIRADLGDALGVTIPVPMLFTLRTVAALAESLRPLLPVAPGGAPGRMAAQVAVAGREVAVPGADPDPLPLSANQRSVLARVAAGADPTINLPLCVRMTGELNPPALGAALIELVGRHDILRTTVHAGNAGPRQQLWPVEPVDLPMVDLTGLPTADAERIAVPLSVSAARAPFDLRHSPVLHAVLFRLSPTDHVLSVTLHQLAGDVWSMEGVGRKLIMYYQAARSATRPEPDPVVQYADWALAQSRWLGSTQGRAQRDWWRHQLAGLPTLSLPLRGPRLQAARSASQALEFTLDESLLSALGRLGRLDSATLYIVLSAAYRLVLGAWSGRPDMAIGCPTTGRTHPDLATTIGPLVNALVLRVAVPDDPSFRDLLRRTRDTALAAYAHQDVPFAQLVVDLDADRDPGRHPLYQASIALHYPNQEVPYPTGLSVTDFGERPPPHTSLDVDLTVYVENPGATCALTYRTDLLTEADAGRFAATFVRVLHSVVAQPDRQLSAHAARQADAPTPA